VSWKAVFTTGPPQACLDIAAGLFQSAEAMPSAVMSVKCMHRPQGRRGNIRPCGATCSTQSPSTLPLPTGMPGSFSSSVDFSASAASLRHKHPSYHPKRGALAPHPQMCAPHLTASVPGTEVGEVRARFFGPCASLAAEAIMDGQEARLMASTMWPMPRARLGREVVG
jgi:hypothetical protein